jgi:hypothetical protein
MQMEMAPRKWGHLIFRTPAPGAKGAQPLRTRSKTKALAHRMRERWRRYRVFAMKHIQPFRPRLLNTVPMHYLLAFRAIGIRNYC